MAGQKSYYEKSMVFHNHVILEHHLTGKRCLAIRHLALLAFLGFWNGRNLISRQYRSHLVKALE
jgi:hypothetical protein